MPQENPGSGAEPQGLISNPQIPWENQKLYDAMSAFLQRDDTYAIAQQQRHLLTLILRKLLASSARAVAGTPESLRKRPRAILNFNISRIMSRKRDDVVRFLDDELLPQVKPGKGYSS